MKKMYSIFIVALLLVGAVSAASFVSAQAPGDPYVAVGWEVVDQFEEISHGQESSDWMFGPQPTITIEYADNGTDIAENYYQVDVGDLLFINITIPKTFLGVDVDLDTVKFWGSAYNVSQAVFYLEYNVTADVWIAPVTLHYTPGATGPSFSNFLSASLENSSYEESTDDYNVVFAVTFTEAVLQGVFWTGMQAIDEM
ncbi:MAG: hypothetical protein ACTSU3_00505, partial [Candidatus Thorarchaeota archaeon]